MKTSVYIISCISLFLVILQSCSRKEDKTNLPSDYKLSDKVEKVIDSLNFLIYDVDKIYSIGLGNDGTLYECVTKYATVEDLIFLTNHKAAKVRCVAFSALTYKNLPEVKKIFIQHKNDTALVMAGGGSIYGKVTVAYYMLDQLHPAYAVKKVRFNRKEFDSIKKLIHKSN